MWSLDRPEPIWVQTPKQVRQLKEQLEQNTLAAIDTETTSLIINKGQVVFWSISTFVGDRYFLTDEMLGEFESVFADPKRKWVGTNVKYDANIMRNGGFPLAGDLICTLVMDRLNDADNPHGLKETYEREFGEQVRSFKEVFYPRNKKGQPMKPKKKEQYEILLDAWNTNPNSVIDYASLDAWMSLRLYNTLKNKLKCITTWKGDTMWDVFLEWEVPFTKVLYDCETTGVLVDKDYLDELGPKMDQELEVIEKKLNKSFGTMLNPRSPKQLCELFFDKLGLKPIKKTKGGAISTDESVLSKFADKGVKEAKLVLRHRSISKTKSTYVDGILNWVDDDNRVHSNISQHAVVTARLSMQDPPLQTIPRPLSDKFAIRKAFIARPGYRVGSGDYSQLEMYLMADRSEDQGMLDSIRNGRDLHAGNASLIWQEPYKEIIESMRKEKAGEDLSHRDILLLGYRQYAKVIGFGLNYGKGANLLSEELKLAKEVRKKYPHLKGNNVKYKAKDMAQDLIDKYFERMPDVKDYIDFLHREASKTKYVETLIGRRRWLREIMTEEDQQMHGELARSYGKKDCWCNLCRASREGQRRAVNTDIQGTAADVCQAAMLTIARDPQLSECKMLFPVHDEILFEIPKEIEEEATARIRYDMINCGLDLDVKLKVDVGLADNWAGAH